jgi:hypothetical protein
MNPFQLTKEEFAKAFQHGRWRAMTGDMNPILNQITENIKGGRRA